MKKFICCPVCKGKGEIAVSDSISKELMEKNRKWAIQMRKKGMTIREIMKALGYKYPGSIQHLLKGENK